ncbi:hypothetical protein EVAR_51739_1 [Eumeta japonica]|uniref:Uncharacterized protein n=1 Tax=Eumeta variegata TaxID=151549 RepID=A0A4C1XJW0_EUMVA|nr:hypothetical protein EVAR_51739_1 [Eumeta japonica]
MSMPDKLLAAEDGDEKVGNARMKETPASRPSLFFGSLNNIDTSEMLLSQKSTCKTCHVTRLKGKYRVLITLRGSDFQREPALPGPSQGAVSIDDPSLG